MTSGILTNPLSPLAPYASAIKVVGGIVAGLALLGLVWSWHARGAKIEALRNKNAQTEAKLAISNASIADLQSAIDAKNAESDARAAAFEKSRLLALQDAQRLETQAKASRSQIGQLKALAASTRQSKDCTVPKELSDALTGL